MGRACLVQGAVLGLACGFVHPEEIPFEGSSLLSRIDGFEICQHFANMDVGDGATLAGTRDHRIRASSQVRPGFWHRADLAVMA